MGRGASVIVERGRIAAARRKTTSRPCPLMQLQGCRRSACVLLLVLQLAPRGARPIVERGKRPIIGRRRVGATWEGARAIIDRVSRVVVPSHDAVDGLDRASWIEVPRTRPRIGVGISVVVGSIRISAPHNDTAAIVVRGKRPKVYGVRVCATTEDHWT